jgi:DNA-binding CsgD family transcriptional regulator
MGADLHAFSRYAADLAARATAMPPDALAGWAVARLADAVGLDAAWYGWAAISDRGADIHASATFNLPEGFYEDWHAMADQDPLARQMQRAPGGVALYDRDQQDQTDGLLDLTRRYGLRRAALAMRARPGQRTGFYVSGYRGGRGARDWRPDELEFLQCAVDQASWAMSRTINADRPGPVVTVFADHAGVSILGLGRLRTVLGAHLADMTDDRLPDDLRALTGRAGRHVLGARGKVADVAPVPAGCMTGLARFDLRPMTARDRLTPREAEVAGLLAAGLSHKQTARRLAVAPATVRNQTRAIYEKLGVGNRAELAGALRDT